MDKELLRKAKETKTMEEFMALLSQNDIEIDEDEAGKIFALLNSEDALNDDELDNISAGGCSSGKKSDCTVICPECSSELKVSGSTNAFSMNLFRTAACLRCGYIYAVDKKGKLYQIGTCTGDLRRRL